MSKLPNSKLQKKDGFTLLEMIISIGIFVLIATASSVLFNQALNAYRYTTSRMAAAREASLAMDWIVRDIRPDPDTTRHPIVDASSDNTRITLVPDPNSSPNQVRYIRLPGDSTIRRVRLNDPGSPQDLLAQNVVALSFNYFNPQHQPPANRNDATMVEIFITTNVNGQEFRLYSVADH
jgi:prepilin-type N-terminal cleavage/methylation domain-containing protein